MPLYSLPSITEDRFTSYLANGYSGSYQIQKAFTAAEYQLPMIMVKAGKFKEIEPQTGVYEGNVAIAIITQVDDVENPVVIHDGTVAAVYDLIANQFALFTFVNAAGNNFTLWALYISSYDQDVGGKNTERALTSILELQIQAQTLEV